MLKYLTLLLLVCGVILVGPGAAATTRTAAEIVIARAERVIGTRYRWGGADPHHGFDCSGLTMWAWSKVGVVLPHNALQQYRSTKHVHRRHLQPGDLLFFYRPIHHVAIYLGDGRMIHANHVGGRVKRSDVSWGSFVSGGRPHLETG